jgi:hypothetical protein
MFCGLVEVDAASDLWSENIVDLVEIRVMEEGVLETSVSSWLHDNNKQAFRNTYTSHHGGIDDSFDWETVGNLLYS